MSCFSQPPISKEQQAKTCFASESVIFWSRGL